MALDYGLKLATSETLLNMAIAKKITSKKITKKIAVKVLLAVDAGLVSGLREQVPGKMCVEAAVCYALGLPHGDDPKCVAQSLRRLKIRLNDASWSSSKARAKGLRRLAVAQLGSIGVLDEMVFTQKANEMTIRKILPPMLRCVANRQSISKHKEA